MNVGSLFSGIGGIELGFEAEGFTTKWFVEYELYAQAILRKRFPDATIYGDITTLDFTTVPKVDILTGGFPCQDISNAGKRAGITGSRSSLWKYYCEAIRILRPKYALIENVAALTSRGLNVVLADLAQIGYDAEWYNLSASAVGALHRRERLFIIAYPNNNGFCESGHGSTQGQNNIHEERNSSTCGERPERFNEAGESRADVSDSEGERLQRQQESERVQTTKSFSCVGGYVENPFGDRNATRDREENSGREEKKQSANYIKCTGWWATEPNVGRVAHGISSRVDRIRCLGNAVVPACAQVFAQAIKEVEGDR